jgi:hypothetical protein
MVMIFALAMGSSGMLIGLPNQIAKNAEGIFQ